MQSAPTGDGTDPSGLSDETLIEDAIDNVAISWDKDSKVFLMSSLSACTVTEIYFKIRDTTTCNTPSSINNIEKIWLS